MKHRVKTGLLGLGSALATIAIVGIAFASGPDVPKGPSIDFCPTTAQIEAHFKQYGFDYKPTVTCGENGEEMEGPDVSEGVEVSQSTRFAREKERLLKATRGPEVDGDPSTMEIVYADGTKSVIFIQTDTPGYWKDKTPAEFAELMYP